MRKKIFAIAFCVLMAFASVACNKKDVYVPYTDSKESASMLNFSSSDKALDAFLNDYLHRHLRYDEYRIGDLPLGSSVMFNKEWEAMSLFFFDSTSPTVPDDRVAMMEDFINNIPVDKFGYVWQSMAGIKDNESEPGDEFGQGWPFPDYDASLGYSAGWEFNAAGTNDNWEVFVDGIDMTDVTLAQNGLLTALMGGFKYTEFVSPVTNINTYHAPFLNMDIRLSDADGFGDYSNFDDVYIYWQTEGDRTFSDEKMVKQSEFATIPTAVTSNFERNLYLPMYLHPEWGTDKTVTRIKIELRSKTKKGIVGSAALNYVRASYDTRHTNNIELLLRAAKLHYEFTGKKDVLETNLKRYRQSLLFLLEHCGGKDGLINMEYFVGHEGATRSEVGSSIGQGYWDLISTPNYSLYSNTYFYKAVDSMLYLEKMAKECGIEQEMPTVIDKSGTGTVAYADVLKAILSDESGDAFTADKAVSALSGLLDTVKDKIREPVDTDKKTGFWDGEKGRFIEGFNKDGDVVDYGFIMYNLEVIAAGIASDDQAKQIMDWVSGARIVESDKQLSEQNYATGKTGTALKSDGTISADGTLGIYDYEFAPRSTTVKNYNQYYWSWGGSNKFGGQVQDGGAIMYLSYYDIMSRIGVYGADDAFKRLKEIQKWYNKVEAVAAEVGVDTDTPSNRFYREYYWKLNIPMQGGGSAGGIGLDYEFLESALLYASIPYGFFGLGSTKYKTLDISPELPASLSWWKMENLAFHGVKYDLIIDRNYVRIDVVRGNTVGLSADISLKKPNGSFTVKLDGRTLDASEYSVDGDRVTVNVPFGACKVEIA